MEIPKGKEIFRLVIYKDEDGKYGSMAEGKNQTSKDILSTLYSLNHTAAELMKGLANSNGGAIVERGGYTKGLNKEEKPDKMFDVE
jgi:hypothetical protein